MSTRLELLPQKEKDRMKRLRKYSGLIRMSLGMSIKEFAINSKLTYPTYANIENDNGAYTVKSYFAIIRTIVEAMDPKKTAGCSWSKTHKNAAITAYIYEILVKNPDNYPEEIRDKCEYYANLFVPAKYAGTVGVDKINGEFYDHFVMPYGVYMKDWSYSVYGDFWNAEEV